MNDHTQERGRGTVDDVRQMLDGPYDGYSAYQWHQACYVLLDRLTTSQAEVEALNDLLKEKSMELEAAEREARQERLAKQAHKAGRTRAEAEVARLTARLEVAWAKLEHIALRSDSRWARNEARAALAALDALAASPGEPD